MNGKDIELSRRRVLGGIATVGAASAAAGAGTFALFSDEESSTGNSVTAGSLNLEFNEDISDADLSLGVDKAVPGETHGHIVIKLTNSGDIEGQLTSFKIGDASEDNFEYDLRTEEDNTATDFEDSKNDSTELQSELEVAAFISTDLTDEEVGAYESEFSPSGTPTEIISEWETLSSSLQEFNNNNSPLPESLTGTKYLIFEYRLPDTDNNQIQGDHIEFDLQLTFEQSTS